MTLFIPKALEALAAVCESTGGARFAGIAGVQLSVAGHGFTAVATDMKGLALCHAPSVMPVGAGATFAALESANGGTQAVVPAKDWKEALRLGGKAKKSGPVGAAIAADGSKVRFACGEHTHEAAPVEGRFPDYRAIMPRKPPVATVTVDPNRLIELLKVLAAVANTADGVPKVTLHIYAGRGQPVGCSAVGADGLVCDALLMPVG